MDVNQEALPKIRQLVSMLLVEGHSQQDSELAACLVSLGIAIQEENYNGLTLARRSLDQYLENYSTRLAEFLVQN
jgi:hypothetical protein